jgi:hypothetical protein
MNPAAATLILLFCLASLALAWWTGLLMRRKGRQ